MLFPFEREALAQHGIARGRTLLDLGCGQGSFLALIAEAFPGLRCVGVDRHQELLEEARARPGIAAVASCDLANPQALLRVLREHRPDSVLCRFVLQHMSPAEGHSLLMTLAEHVSRHPLQVVLADVDGTSSFFDPPSALLAEAREGLGQLQARLGGDRKIGARLPLLLQEAGFDGVETSRVRISSDALGFASWWAAFGSLLCAGLRSRPSAQEALEEWARDPATATRWRAGFDVCFASACSLEPTHA
ncbi:MAG TPA: methyltransferase [Myxococcales bacterium]|nr:methyltransferase [Myxococcales bacterium]